MGELPTIEDLTNLLVAAHPAPPGTDQVAHAYEWLADVEQAMPVVSVVWSLAAAETRRQVAAEIRAQAADVPLIPLQNGSRLRPGSAVEWAARIAEGADGA